MRDNRDAYSLLCNFLKVRIFRLRTGKLYRVIDESLSHYIAMHQGGNFILFHLTFC